MSKFNTGNVQGSLDHQHKSHGKPVHGNFPKGKANRHGDKSGGKLRSRVK